MTLLVAITLLLCRPHNVDTQAYDAWTSTGYHLILSDNGTPEDVEDDWIIDWEDNRDFTVTVND